MKGLNRNSATEGWSLLPVENAEFFEIFKTWSLPATIMVDKRGSMVGKAVDHRDRRSDSSSRSSPDFSTNPPSPIVGP